MAKRTPGLRKKGEIWQIEKVIAGELVRVSTGETELEKAEQYLAQLIEKTRKVKIYGQRLERTFDQAAARYVEEYSHKRSLDRDINTLKAVMPYIGDIDLRKIHSGVLDVFIKDRRKAGITAGTLNRDLSIIKRVLKLCAELWRDENGNPWLDTAPMLVKVQGEKRKPRPITWDEQSRLLAEMPKYLAEMCLFALNTGLRDQEICGLKWDSECKINGIDGFVFVIEDIDAKNNKERIVVLNATACNIVNARRGNESEYVFDYEGRRLDRMNNRAWRKAVSTAGIVGVRVHDLRHTFGKRLRSAGVEHNNLQDLLGHYNGNITTHYCAAEIGRLIECVELLCESRKPELTLIRKCG
jgi:integrase